MEKNVITMVTAGVIGVASLFPASAGAEEILYSDLQGHWAEKYVQHIQETGILENNGEHSFFNPSIVVKKDQVESLLMKASGNDIDIDGVKRSDIVEGIVRAFDLDSTVDELSDEKVDSILAEFVDEADIPQEDRKALAYMVKEDIMNGSGQDKLNPGLPTTKAQMATLISRIANETEISLPQPGTEKNKQKMMEKMESHMTEVKSLKEDIQVLFEELDKEDKLTDDQLKQYDSIITMMNQKKEDMKEMKMNKERMETHKKENKQMMQTLEKLIEELRDELDVNEEQIDKLDAIESNAKSLNEKIMTMCEQMKTNMDMEDKKENDNMKKEGM